MTKTKNKLRTTKGKRKWTRHFTPPIFNHTWYQ